MAPEAAVAQKARLLYVSDATPGIRRQGALGRFRYVAPSGGTVRARPTLERIRLLVIPPAWREVWICPHADGHLQVTARDVRGRKQYRYHARWRATRDADKYDQLQDFVQALPAIRRAVAAHLRLPGLPREKVLAAVVSLLERTFIRIGNKKYLRENGSYGLTTLKNRHVRVRGASLEFDFRGKSGKQHQIALTDARLAAIVRRCRDLPGQELFQYLDENGDKRTVSSADVNDYLAAISGGKPYTAKDFRTWAGTLLAAYELRPSVDFRSETEAKKNIAAAIKRVAERLGNTPAICRKCYIHPGVLDAYMDGRLAELPLTAVTEAALPQLTRRHEIAVARLLRLRKGKRAAAAAAASAAH